MSIAVALIRRPKVLLLDEVTKGLRPRSARFVKDLILAQPGGTPPWSFHVCVTLSTSLTSDLGSLPRKLLLQLIACTAFAQDCALGQPPDTTW